MFIRKLTQRVTEQLKKEKLFQAKLLPDIREGAVFPAIRNNEIDFYHNGGKIFSFDGKFHTHIKYASIYESNKDYISEEELSKTRPIKDFTEGYDRIKENCSLYSGVEASGISSLYSKCSYIKEIFNVMVLDIEVSFKSLKKDKKQDRIDLLLFNQEEKCLRFYEAKHFSNKEIWSREGTTPKVIKQVRKYERQIRQKQSEIIEQYINCINIVNRLFSLEIKKPKGIDSKVALLIFGFDRDQLRGRFKTLLKNDSSLHGVNYYAIGDILGTNIKNMWDKLK